MAPLREVAAVPKVRSRRDGSAVPLDAMDKQLLNLMQGSFPLARGHSPTWPAWPR